MNNSVPVDISVSQLTLELLCYDATCSMWWRLIWLGVVWVFWLWWYTC